MLNALSSRHAVRGACVALMVVGCASLAFAQATRTADSIPSRSTDAPRTDYQLGPGDLLSVAVSGLKEFDARPRVSNSGKIHLPYLGIIRAAGLSVTDLEREIASAVRERGLVTNPWVTVRVDQYRAQPVYILGEVMLPGQFVIKNEMYLADLISLGGGFNEVATPVGYLYRRKETQEVGDGESSTDEAIPIDFKALNEGRSPELNIKLRGGDVLYVPQRRKEYFFVVGDVLAPGPFEIQADAPQVLISQAFAKAGGPLRTAKISKAVLVRFDQNGTRHEQTVDFSAILRGRQPDVAVQANDIIFVPGSTTKTLGFGLLRIVPWTLTSSAHR